MDAQLEWIYASTLLTPQRLKMIWNMTINIVKKTFAIPNPIGVAIVAYHLKIPFPHRRALKRLSIFFVTGEFSRWRGIARRGGGVIHLSAHVGDEFLVKRCEKTCVKMFVLVDDRTESSPQFVAVGLCLKQTNKQTNKQTSKQTNKQTSKQANKQTNKQTNKQANKQTSRKDRPVVCQRCWTVLAVENFG